MNYQYIPNIILFIIGAEASTSTINNEFVQLGFLGILLTILIWYSRNSYKENVKREAAAEKEKQSIIDRYEGILKEKDTRYHELHLEIMAMLKMKINGK